MSMLTDRHEPRGREQFAVPKPLYSQVRDRLGDLIAGGEWSPSEALPNETQLSQRFGVSIGTIRRAVEGLEDLGIVVRRQGRGTFVAGLGVPAVADRLSRIRGPSGQPLTLDHRAISAGKRAARPAEAHALALSDGEDVVEVRSAIVADNAVIGIESSVLPAHLCPRLEGGIPNGQSLYAVLGEDGVMVIRAEESVLATEGIDADRVALEVSDRDALLQVERRAYAFGDRLVELRTSIYLSKAVIYQATIT